MSSNRSLLKQKRVTKACDFCHRRGRKCRPPADPNEKQCLTCAEFKIPCTWERISVKRGTKSRTQNSVGSRWAMREDYHGPRGLIHTLVEAFFECVYPVAIIINEKSFMEKWLAQSIPEGRSAYAKIMSMCALSAQRIIAGATLSTAGVPKDLNPKLYLDEALDAISTDVADVQDLENLQAIGIVCLTALEVGDVSLLHHYLGLYHSAIAKQGLSDERRWPRDLSIIEQEERRRLFWYMYRLEVHASLINGHAVRCPESQSAVAYPTLPDDDYTESSEELEWLSGWNFVTDLYRGLEHLISYFRFCLMPVNTKSRTFSTAFLFEYQPQERILDPLAATFLGLPQRFKKARQISTDVRQNRCGFQTANIACTYQLVRMVSYTLDNSTFNDACRTAMELIEEITAIPIDYLKVMSLAMMQELSGFGHILSSFIGKNLSRRDYKHLKVVMLCMSELLESLSSSISSAAQASMRLRGYVSGIDHLLNRTQLNSLDHGGNDIAASTLPTSASVNQFEGGSSEAIIPWEFLQDIPWPGGWLDQMAAFEGI